MRLWLGSLLMIVCCLGCSSDEYGDKKDAGVSLEARAPHEAGAPQDGGRARDSAFPTGPIKTAVGEPLGEPIKVTISPAGGAAETQDGRLVVTFPEGAVASDTEVSLTVITNTFPTGVGVAYRLEPSGVTFAKPVSLTVHVEESDLAHSSIGGLEVAWQNSEGYWEPVEELTRDTTAKTVTAKVTHFCSLSLLQGFEIQPRVTQVSNGRSVRLEVFYCAGNWALAGGPPVYGCGGGQGYVDKGEIIVSNWSVNSQSGGTAELGLITGDTETEVIYNAPAKPPKPPRVAVSVEVKRMAPPSAEKLILVSNVTVLEENDLTGTFKMTYKPGPLSPVYAAITSEPFSVRGHSLKIKRVDDGALETNYEVTGKVGIAPSAFYLGAKEVVCRIKQWEKDIAPHNMKVRKSQDPKNPAGWLRWIVATDWTYTCTGPMGFQMDLSPIIMFGTGSGTGCLTPNDLPLKDYLQPSGSASSNCMGDGETQMTFEFYPPAH